MRISYSNAFGIKCPRRIYMALSGAPVEVVHDEEETVAGIEIHELLKDFVQAGVKERAVIREELAEKITDLSMISVVSTIEKKLTNPNLVNVVVEEKMEFQEEEDTIVIIPDLLLEYPDHLEVYDYKTSFGNTIYHEWEAQAKLYSYLLARKYEKPVKYFIWFVRFNNIKDLPLPSTRSLERWFYKELKRIREIVEKKITTPLPGRDCVYCPFILSCPHAQRAVIKTQEEAEAEVREILKLQAELAMRKKRVHDWVNKHGNIRVDGREYGYTEQETLEVDEVGLLLYATQEKPEYFGRIIKADKRELRRMLRKDENLAEFITFSSRRIWDGKFRGKLVEEEKPF